ncbi:hypothetical protein [Mucilaginibacter sp. CSA2-8R]|uniref:hypothetical protein n=1 Tax=Mucilaginibacter sp. CSA2-8R TaxID=3141542 RepID=UPI00315D233E
MRVRKAVRLLYAQHSEYFYDNDQREDLSESTVSMHSLACSTFYMILDCNYCDEYVVEYDIESSPFKDEIARLISRGPMYSIGKQVTHESTMEAHFQYMRTYHNDNPKHFSYLNIEIEQQD